MPRHRQMRGAASIAIGCAVIVPSLAAARVASATIIVLQAGEIRELRGSLGASCSLFIDDTAKLRKALRDPWELPEGAGE